MKLLLFINVLCLNVLTLSAHADPCAIYVPHDAPTIQSAINAAPAGAHIVLDPCIYTGPGNVDLDYLGKPLTLRSLDPCDPCIVAATIIDCQAAYPAPLHRACNFRHNETRATILSGITITNGYGPWEDYNGYPASIGGAIYCHNASPVITRCRFLNNGGESNTYGGAILINGGNPLVSHCTFRQNRAYADGGCINARYSVMEIRDCIFIENQAGYGAAIFTWQADALIRACTFRDNLVTRASSEGGAVYVGGDAPALVTQCVFERNRAPDKGGALAATYADLDITTCLFRDNTAGYLNGIEGYGGAVSIRSSESLISGCIFTANRSDYIGGAFYANQSDMTIENCLFDGNLAERFGGALYIWLMNPVLRHCTITGNHAFDHGGGYYGEKSQIDFLHCILWNNRADNQGDQIALASHFLSSAADLTARYCSFPRSSDDIYLATGHSLTCIPGHLTSDPCFVDNGSWSNPHSSDPCDDFWITGDYHLRSIAGRWDPCDLAWLTDAQTSPCIDAGNPGLVSDNESSHHPTDPCSLFSTNIRVNLGAYGNTAQASICPLGWSLLSDIDNSGIVDLFDLALFFPQYRQSDTELPCDLNRDGTVNPLDLLPLINDWLIRTLRP